jgi:GxxExxY protein
MNMDENALSNQIIGAAIEVHRLLGPGLLENVYQAALECELGIRNLRFESQKPLPVIYKGSRLNIDYRMDFLVDDRVVIELKAVEQILDVHKAQILTYLKLSGCKLGLLMNFNVPVMKNGITRFANGLAAVQPFPGQKLPPV